MLKTTIVVLAVVLVAVPASSYADCVRRRLRA